MIRAWGWGALLAAALAGAAQEGAPDRSTQPAGRVAVHVVPDRPDWLYSPGEAVRFHVRAESGGRVLRGVDLQYKVGLENLPAEERTIGPPEADTWIEGGTLTTPGFLRCVVQVKVGGRSYRGTAVAGFAPGRIAPTQTEPGDFDAFWDRGKSELMRVPIDARLELLPGESQGAINVYHVSFRNWARTESRDYPGRIYGILCEPKAAGRYPAYLRFPAAGVRPYGGERALAEQGAITLEIGIHGIPVNQAREIYDQLRTGSLDGYPTFNLDDPGRYFFRRVHLGGIRALDFLVTRPGWDGRTLIAFGASQGGMLALACAALDSRVTAVAAMIPAYCDVTGYLHGRAGGWPHLFRSPGGTPAQQEKIVTTGYYDVVNFARRIRVPTLVALGYNDENCPPTSVYAAYNGMAAPKELAVFLRAAHEITPEMNDRVRAWLRAMARREIR